MSEKIAVLTFSCAIPAIFGAFVTLYALIQNNNQGEVFDTMTGDYRYWYLSDIFAISFGVIFFVIFSLMVTFLLAISFVRKFKARERR